MKYFSRLILSYQLQVATGSAIIQSHLLAAASSATLGREQHYLRPRAALPSAASSVTFGRESITCKAVWLKKGLALSEWMRSRDWAVKLMPEMVLWVECSKYRKNQGCSKLKYQWLAVAPSQRSFALTRTIVCCGASMVAHFARKVRATNT